MSLMRNDLELRLIGRIEREGPITFRDFMQTALYDPDQGYYNTERIKIGPQGDYYTSSNVHPAFGAVLARAFVQLWNELEPYHSRALRIVEIGAGTGRLACDVLTALRDQHPEAFREVDYLIIESSPEMRRRERELLAGFEGRVHWGGLGELGRKPMPGIFFSNELVDALPVHRVRFERSDVEEQYVTIAARRLALSWAQPSTPEIMNYLGRAGVKLAEGQLVEINLDAIEWLAQVSRAIGQGFLITIDYGDLSPLLCASDRRNGTMRSFYNHRLVDSPLERVGEQDMTASVNFTALLEYGPDFGLETLSYERQVAFLVRMGLIDMIAQPSSANPSRQEMNERLALKNLFVPGGVSDNFRVLIQRKICNPGL
jgi:SAM-dependent MidA family methyltransferase